MPQPIAAEHFQAMRDRLADIVHEQKASLQNRLEEIAQVATSASAEPLRDPPMSEAPVAYDELYMPRVTVAEEQELPVADTVLPCEMQASEALPSENYDELLLAHGAEPQQEVMTFPPETCDQVSRPVVSEDYHQEFLAQSAEEHDQGAMPYALESYDHEMSALHTVDCGE